MNKRIVILVSLIAAGVAVFFLLYGVKEVPEVPARLDDIGLSEPESEKTAAEVKEEAWALFERYLAAAKAHDLETVRTLSYQLSEACLDPARREECNALMDNVYSFGSEFKKEGFTEMDFDQRQIILSTPFTKNLEGEAPSMTRAVIYFVRPSGRPLQFLSLKPFDGAFIIRTGQATSTIDTRLEQMVLDSDKDGLPDEIETCADADTACIRTDPKKRDTDGDGWWDGIEALFYKK